MKHGNLPVPWAMPSGISVKRWCRWASGASIHPRSASSGVEGNTETPPLGDDWTDWTCPGDPRIGKICSSFSVHGASQISWWIICFPYWNGHKPLGTMTWEKQLFNMFNGIKGDIWDNWWWSQIFTDFPMVFAVLHSHFAPWFSPAQIGGSGGSVRGGADCHALRLRGNQGESDRCVEGLQRGRCEEGQGVATINVPRFLEDWWRYWWRLEDWIDVYWISTDVYTNISNSSIYFSYHLNTKSLGNREIFRIVGMARMRKSFSTQQCFHFMGRGSQAFFSSENGMVIRHRQMIRMPLVL